MQALESDRVKHWALDLQTPQGHAAFTFSIGIQCEAVSKSLCVVTHQGDPYIEVISYQAPSLRARRLLGFHGDAGTTILDLPRRRGVSELNAQTKHLASIGTEASMSYIEKVQEPACITSNDETVGLSVADIIARARKGEAVSLDLLLAAFMTASKKGSILYDLKHLPHQTRGHSFVVVDRDVITKSQLEQWRIDTGKQIKMSLESTAAPDSPFIRSVDGVLTRKGVDAIDCGAYVWHRGKIYMPIKIGVRPAKALMPELSELTTPWAEIGGVAGSVEPGETDADLAERAFIETEEELTMRCLGKPIRVASFYTLPDSATERVTSFLTEIDPDDAVHREQGIDESVSIRFIELDELLEAFEEGVITDGRLALTGYMAKCAFGYHNAHLEDYSKLGEHILLFGGTFDPFHQAHEQMVERHAYDGSVVLIVPAKQNPLKTTLPMLSEAERFESIVATASQIPNAHVSDIELQREGVSRTIATVRELRERLSPGSRLELLMGSDLLEHLPEWLHVDELFGLVDGVIVEERPSFDRRHYESIKHRLSASIQAKIETGWQSEIMVSIASTAIRSALASGALTNIDENVPEPVWDYLVGRSSSRA